MHRRRSLTLAGLLALPFVFMTSAAQAQKWVDEATISASAPLSAGHVCYTDGRDIACDASAPLMSGLGVGLGDRIISGTTAIVANSATSIISVTTSGVNTGYFNSNGVLTAPGISATANLTSVTTLYASGNQMLLGTPTSYVSSGWTTLTIGNATNGGLISFQQNGLNQAIINGSSNQLNFVAPAVNITSGTGSTFYALASSGKVGIGTTAPAQVLHVYAPTAAVAKFTNNGYATNGMEVGLNGAAGRIQVLENLPLNFLTNNTQQMTITGDGNVGIGATSPGAKLVVSNNASAPQSPKVGTMNTLAVAQFAAADATATRVLIDNYGSVPTLDFREARNTAASPAAVQNADNLGQLAWFGYGATGYAPSARALLQSFAAENWTDTAQSTYMVFATTAPSSTSAAEHMRLDSSGNLGLGTSTPAYKLDVNGWSQFADPNGNVVLLGTAVPSGKKGISIYYDASSDAGMLQSIYQGTSTKSLLINPSGGNVGIGNTSPNAKLDVNGTVSATNLAVSGFTFSGPNACSGGLALAVPYGNAESIPTVGSLNSTCAPVIGYGVFPKPNGTGFVSSEGSAALARGALVLADTLTYYTAGAQTVASGTAITMTPRLTVNSSGNVGIGTTTPADKLEISGGKFYLNTHVSKVSNAIMYIAYTGGGSQYGMEFQPGADGAEALGFLNAAGTTVGSIVNTATATTFNTSSDRRLKENIVDTTQGLATLDRIRVRDFNFIADPRKTRVQGFIAQDLYKVYPEAVTVGGADPKKQPWTVDYGRLTPLLVQSVQEQQVQLSHLEASNDNLRSEVEQLKLQVQLLRDLNRAKSSPVSLGDAACTPANVGSLRRNAGSGRPEICH